MAVARSSPSDLGERLLAGDRRALGRAISLVEDGDAEGEALVRALYPRTGSAAIVGITGPPGAGKSTLIGAMVAHARAGGRDVAVLSVDPSSPFTHGALLGDRIRLVDHYLDPGVFIRSMATRGSLGGLAEAALSSVALMDAAGYDEIYLETVGVGQAEVDVAGHAHTVVLVLAPGGGDSIQALKAGVMEIPDVIVVNKADDPRADATVREVRATLSLGGEHGPRPPIVRTDALRSAGVEELAERIAEHREATRAGGPAAQRRHTTLAGEVIGLAAARVRRRLELALREDPGAADLIEQVAARRLDPASAAQALLDRER